jgi:hypothetical protein
MLLLAYASTIPPPCDTNICLHTHLLTYQETEGTETKKFSKISHESQEFTLVNNEFGRTMSRAQVPRARQGPASRTPQTPS